MILFNGDIEILFEDSEWVVYCVKAMDYLYAVKIPKDAKKQAESSKEELDNYLLEKGIDFKDLVIDIRRGKGKDYKNNIVSKIKKIKGVS
jgi:hypothetical protein